MFSSSQVSERARDLDSESPVLGLRWPHQVRTSAISRVSTIRVSFVDIVNTSLATRLSAASVSTMSEGRLAKRALTVLRARRPPVLLTWGHPSAS